MIADGAEPCMVPAKHLRTMVWLAQRLGMKMTGGREQYSTVASRKAVADFYLAGKHMELSAPLQVAIDQWIDQAGTNPLHTAAFLDIRLERPKISFKNPDSNWVKRPIRSISR